MTCDEDGVPGDNPAGYRRLQQACEDRVRALNTAIEQRERELLILSHAAARVHGAENMQEIFDIALEEILGGLELTAAWIFVGNVNEQKLRAAPRAESARAISSGCGCTASKAASVPRSSGVGIACRRGTPRTAHACRTS